MALFRREFFFDFTTVALSFVCDKYYSRDLQLNCIISFYFRLYLMLYACTVRFEVT